MPCASLLSQFSWKSVDFAEQGCVSSNPLLDHQLTDGPYKASWLDYEKL